MIELRPYQAAVATKFEAKVAAGKRRVILVAPTGSGKTVIASAIIAGTPRRVLVISHRREIVHQTSDKLTAAGVPHGVIQAGDEKKLRPLASVQVASIQTLHARAIRSSTMLMPLADLLIIDEAHHACAATYRKILKAYPDAIVLGLTATPCRGDGRGLGGIFETMIECPQVADLIVGGFLVKSRVYAPVDPDLRGVRTKQGDYVVGQLERRMNTDALVGDIVEHWLKYGERRRTVVFAVGVEHSVHIRNEFLQFGVRAEHLDGTTPVIVREAILARLASGETEVVTNCMVLSEGWDMPAVGCCILARPTKQMGLFRQMIGRILRPADGKPDAVILDHSGAVYRHGLPEDHVEWTLAVDRGAVNPAQAKRERGEAPKQRECPSCKAVMVAPPCGACGWQPQPRARGVDFEDGELGLVVGGNAKASVYSESDRTDFFQQLRAVQQMRGYKRGWAAHKFKEKFGTFPPWAYNDLQPIAPSDALLRWVLSRNIAYAKATRGAA
jgi:superfamily II DNA or RNA helicase